MGDDDYSWAVDGMRSMKWHGNTSPVSSPYAHGVPYGGDWRWNAGDAIGCELLIVDDGSHTHPMYCQRLVAFYLVEAWSNGIVLTTPCHPPPNPPPPIAMFFVCNLTPPRMIGAVDLDTGVMSFR